MICHYQSLFSPHYQFQKYYRQCKIPQPGNFGSEGDAIHLQTRSLEPFQIKLPTNVDIVKKPN